MEVITAKADCLKVGASNVKAKGVDTSKIAEASCTTTTEVNCMEAIIAEVVCMETMASNVEPKRVEASKITEATHCEILSV